MERGSDRVSRVTRTAVMQSPENDASRRPSLQRPPELPDKWHFIPRISAGVIRDHPRDPADFRRRREVVLYWPVMVGDV